MINFLSEKYYGGDKEMNWFETNKGLINLARVDWIEYFTTSTVFHFTGGKMEILGNENETQEFRKQLKTILKQSR